jgi:hypothetical protein
MEVDIEADVDMVDGDDSTVGTRAGAGAGEGVAGVEAEGAGVGMGMERDSESDEIVRVLEKGLPRWEGFEDVGWMADVGQVRAHFVYRFCTTDRFLFVGPACGYRAHHQEFQRCCVSLMFI